MKNFKKILLILILFVILLYVSNISSIPNNLILMQGENKSKWRNNRSC